MSNMMEYLEDLINHPEKAEDLDTVIAKTTSFFDDMLRKLREGTQEEKEEMRENFKRIGEMAEQKMQEIAKEQGLSREDILDNIKNPKNYSLEEWQSLQRFQENLGGSTDGHVGKKNEKKKRASTKRSKWITA